jgi:hypothetical protein
MAGQFNRCDHKFPFLFKSYNNGTQKRIDPNEDHPHLLLLLCIFISTQLKKKEMQKIKN